MLKIKVNDWDTYNPRGDYVNPTWFRFNASMITSVLWDELNSDELKCYIAIMCLATKGKGIVETNTKHISRLANVNTKEFQSTIKKLEQLQLIEIICTEPVRITNGSVQNPVATYVTDITNIQTNNNGVNASLNSLEPKKEPIQELEQIYQLYPKRENTNKKRGMQNLLAKIKTPEQVAEFERAVRNYADYCKQKKIEPVFVKQFSTFTNNYEEWITVEKIVTKTTLQRWQEKGDDDET